MQHQAAGSPLTFDSSNALLAATSAHNSDGTFSAEEAMNPEGLWCEVCKIRCNSLITLPTHKLGKKHRNNLLRLRFAHITAFAPDHAPAPDHELAPNHVVSGVTTNDFKQVVAVQENPFSLRNNPEKIKRIRVYCCDICEINCTSKELLDLHYIGKKHKKNVEPQEAYFCYLCKIKCTSKDLLEFHNNGKKHKKIVENQNEAPYLACVRPPTPAHVEEE